MGVAYLMTFGAFAACDWILDIKAKIAIDDDLCGLDARLFFRLTQRRFQQTLLGLGGPRGQIPTLGMLHS